MFRYADVVPLSRELTKDRRPVVLYGTGNGADKVIEYLSSLGRCPTALFASDGFVRRRTFAGMPVESFSDVAARYGKNMKILMCFGSDRPEVIDNVKRIDAEYDLALPDVPLYGDGIFDEGYFARHAGELLEVRNMLSDEQSKLIFDDAIRYRLTGKLKYLRRVENVFDSYSRFFGARNIVVAVDGGAYRGDSVKNLVWSIPKLKKIYAHEPDPRTFLKLRALGPELYDRNGVTLIAKNTALGADERFVEFSSSSSRGAGENGKNRRSKTIGVCTEPIDKTEDKIDLIKLDVEGAEYDALLGAKNTMKESAPHLAVSLYHRTDDLWRLPLFIKEIYADKNFKYYLRRVPCLPMWDLTLYAVRDSL